MKIIKTFESFEEDGEYTFDELSQDAKDHAIENERNSMYDTIGDWWYEGIIEDEAQKLRDEGLSDVEIEFSGFNSQGDGASFTGRVTDIKLFVEGTLNMQKINDRVLGNINISVVRIDSRHVHENSVRFDCEVEDEDEDEIVLFRAPGSGLNISISTQSQCNDIEEVGGPWLRSRCKEIYSKLNKEYDSYFEDENIIADIKANDYKFDEDGNII
jgi:hypothetical protein